MPMKEHAGRWIEYSDEHDIAPWSSTPSVRALPGTETGAQTLHVVVAQLLAIALRVMNW
jgi:hypothetical protein